MDESTNVAVVADPFVQMVERFATDPSVDANKLEKLVDIQMRVMRHNAETEFNQALAELQAKLPMVSRKSKNDQTNSKYAKHEAIIAEIRPMYTKAGFATSFSQAESNIEGHIRILGTLTHRAGHSREYFVDLPLDNAGIKGNVNKTPMHASSSTFSYGRRYCTLLMFDIATADDNDGNLPALTEGQLADLQAKSEELFGDKGRTTLLNMAANLFRVPAPEDIQSRHFEVALEWLQNKHDSEHQGA